MMKTRANNKVGEEVEGSLAQTKSPTGAESLEQAIITESHPQVTTIEEAHPEGVRVARRVRPLRISRRVARARILIISQEDEPEKICGFINLKLRMESLFQYFP